MNWQINKMKMKLIRLQIWWVESFDPQTTKNVFGEEEKKWFRTRVESFSVRILKIVGLQFRKKNTKWKFKQNVLALD